VFPFGSIVLARFPFTDLSGDKRRPALVVSRDNDRVPISSSASSRRFSAAARHGGLPTTAGPA